MNTTEVSPHLIDDNTPGKLHLRDELALKKKIANMKEAGAANLMILSDFDETMTKRSYCCETTMKKFVYSKSECVKEEDAKRYEADGKEFYANYHNPDSTSEYRCKLFR